jgi:hypothetical protein
MKVFGSLVTVMVTSVRKAITICLSFLVFRDKVFTRWHAGAMLAIAIGTSVSVYDRTRKPHVIDDEKGLLVSVTSSVGEEASDTGGPDPEAPAQ